MSGYFDRRAGLAGTKAAVIGGGYGIGAGVTLALAEAGVDCAICDVDTDSMEETADKARSFGVKITTCTADVTAPASIDAFYDGVERDFPHLDTVVNLAGGTKRGLLVDRTREQIAADIQRNYGYVIQSVQRAIPLLRRTGRGGSIVNFTTIEAHRGASTYAVYAGAKAATTNFTRAMAVELGVDRIRVNCLVPDTTPSRGNLSTLPNGLATFDGLPEGALDKAMAMYIPLKEAPPVEALADAVLFLVSDLARFVTGTNMHVDGGTIAALGWLDWPFGDGGMPAPFVGTMSKLFSND